MSCLFCNIAAGTIPATAVYEDSEILAFRDVAPQAPVHILIIPKRHVANLNELNPEDAALIGRILLTAQRLAKQEGVAEEGYRCVFNTGNNGGQTVHHLHLHLLGGRAFHWPPG